MTKIFLRGAVPTIGGVVMLCAGFNVLAHTPDLSTSASRAAAAPKFSTTAKASPSACADYDQLCMSFAWAWTDGG